MAEQVLANAKIGDRLCISRRSAIWLAVVDRITPGGRVVTKAGTFTPDGYLYGRHDGLSRARLATEDDLAQVYRDRSLHSIATFRDWGKLTMEELEAVASIVSKHKAGD